MRDLDQVGMQPKRCHLSTMWDKPNQLSAIGTARPLRVAYLIDLGNCPDALFDAIFAEAYSRWGGRRTLIIPATPGGIDDRYAQWLELFDADVIYSFVDLKDEAVTAIHERYAPIHLVRHTDHGMRARGTPDFRIELPLEGLTSLSVLPVIASRSWGFDGPPKELKILNKFWDTSESQFLQENFGFLIKSFPDGTLPSAHPSLFSTVTLISQKSLDDKRLVKPPGAFATIEDDVLVHLATTPWLLTPSNLSECLAPFLSTGQDLNHTGTTIVVGDTPADRLLFWNIHHRYDRGGFFDLHSLRLSPEQARDDGFLERLIKILERRGSRGNNGRNDMITLRSCSLEAKDLEVIAAQIQKGKTWLSVGISRDPDAAVCIPTIRDESHVRYGTGGFMYEPLVQAKTEFKGDRLAIPKATPWHMGEALPPAGLRGGNWMIDLVVDRSNDHCKYANRRHVWMLPRRLRLERAFKLELEIEGDRTRGHAVNDIRPVRGGAMSLPLKSTVRSAALTVPDDIEALRIGISNNLEWLPFDGSRKGSPTGRPRFAYSALSDKGRYLLGVFQLFENLPQAFRVLMDSFWRDVLYHLGGVPAEKNVSLRQEFIGTLRKRLGQLTGPLKFEDDDQIERLGREALRFGRKIQREQRYVDYPWLKQKWEGIVDAYLKAHPKPAEDDEPYIRNVRHLNGSIQSLCEREVLFQGLDWSCANCHNKNWVSIDTLARTLECEVCGNKEPAPVAGEWHFRANQFLIDAYRDQGTEAVVFALWQLAESAQDSFYFTPSLRLWLKYPENVKAKWDAEIDALAIVDGKTYMVEAKSSAGLDEAQIKQLVLAATYIRPDVVVIACMEAETDGLRRAVKKLQEALPTGIKVSLLTFKPEMLDPSSPFLPT